MSDNTGIEWADATWNPLVGCTKVSPGCDNCYAEGVVNRFAGHNKAFPNTFDVVTIRDRRMLEQPLRWARPRKVFVNSLSDLFHKDVPDEFIALVFAVMVATPQHTYQLLTKRHGRMRSLLNSEAFRCLVSEALTQWAVTGDGAVKAAAGRSNWYASNGLWPLPNVWLGVSVEDQHWADLRIPALLDTPAAVRWISAEPLLGPVCVTPWLAKDAGAAATLDWVVVGGESGVDARSMHPDWARHLRDDCAVEGVPFLFKQWGSWRPLRGNECARNGDEWPVGTQDVMMRRVAKKDAGRVLDGRTYDGYPEKVHVDA